MTDDFFTTLLRKIEEHPTYNAALRGAVDKGSTLVLNYHSHGDPGSWCVSVCSLLRDPTKLLQIGVPDLDELIHIKGIGSSEEQCLPFCRAFGERLQERYALGSCPAPFLNGLPADDPQAV